jgi:hypothetical protein
MTTELLLTRQEDSAYQAQQWQCPDNCDYCTSPETD